MKELFSQKSKNIAEDVTMIDTSSSSPIEDIEKTFFDVKRLLI